MPIWPVLGWVFQGTQSCPSIATFASKQLQRLHPTEAPRIVHIEQVPLPSVMSDSNNSLIYFYCPFSFKIVPVNRDSSDWHFVTQITGFVLFQLGLSSQLRTMSQWTRHTGRRSRTSGTYQSNPWRGRILCRRDSVSAKYFATVHVTTTNPVSADAPLSAEGFRRDAVSVKKLPIYVLVLFQRICALHHFATYSRILAHLLTTRQILPSMSAWILRRRL